MNGHHRLPPLLALAVALATAPAAAARDYEVHATARGSHGFTVALHAGTVTDFGGQAVDTDPGSVVVSRTSQGQTISRTLRSAKGIKVRATRRLGRARLRLGFGSRGSVALRFRPTGALRKGGSANCGGGVRHRRGVFRGRFRVEMGGVFHTLRRARLRGTLVSVAEPDDCADPSPIGGDENLTVAGTGSSAIFYRVAQPDTGPPSGFGTVDLTARHARHWTESDEITVHRADLFHDDVVPPGDPTVPATASAHVQADGPFLTGALDFGPQPGILVDPELNFSATGPVTGSLTARFDRLGGAPTTLSPATGTLTRECEQCI